MYSPFILQLTGVYIGNREGRMLNSMRQLEDNAQYKPCYTGENDKADQPIRKADGIDRDEHEEESMKKLEAPENEMIADSHSLQRHAAYLALKIFYIVQYKDPEDVQQ